MSAAALTGTLPANNKLLTGANALLVGGAVATSLFFNGIQIQYFYLALLLLSLWLLLTIARNYQHGFCVPQTGIMLCATLFWAWLGVSLLWNPVPQVGINYFWLVGCLPMALWLFTLSAHQDQLWRYSAHLILLIGVALALWGLYQFFIQHEMPRSVFLDINSHASFLNLIALPAAAYFLLASHLSPPSSPTLLPRGEGGPPLPPGEGWGEGGRDNKAVPYKKFLLGAMLFLLFFAIALTKGRAATLSFVLGLILLIWITVHHVPKKDWLTLLALAVGAFTLANLVWSGELAGRIETIFNPGSAGQDRFIIWQQAWEMYKDAPWLGVGLGTFWLAWPPYRHPADASGGYYVHNDYLQIAIEAGLPGLLLLLALLAAAAWLFFRVIRAPHVEPAKRIEIIGLAAGLLAVAAQSFFNFNLYIMPTLIVSGLVLARLQQLATIVLNAPVTTLRANRWLRKRVYYVAAPALVLFVMSYFVAQALADRYYNQALNLANQGKLEAADDALGRAGSLAPLADNVLNTRADLLRHLLTGLAQAAPDALDKQRKILYDAALVLLDQAQELNPLRPDILLTRARLYQENPDLVGADWAQRTQQAYEQALTIDPRFYSARHAYAQMLIAQGNLTQAQNLLEEGMRHQYFAQPKLLPYYVLTANMRYYMRQTARAEELKKEIDKLMTTQGVDPQTLALINQSRIPTPGQTAPASSKQLTPG